MQAQKYFNNNNKKEKQQKQRNSEIYILKSHLKMRNESNH